MKKIILALLVCMMVFGSFGTAFAEELNGVFAEGFLAEGRQARAGRLDVIKEFVDEFHQINALRIERKQLQIQVIEKQDQLLDLYIEARESGDMEALEAAKEERQEIRDIHSEIKALHEQAAEARKAFREAVKNSDMETADEEIGNFMDAHISINDKIEEKIEILLTIIAILS